MLLVSLLLVSFIYQASTPFFKNPEVYSYFFNNLSLYKFQSGIKGVFDANHYHAINGSLWTIRYEFCLYVILVLFFFLRENKTTITFLLLFTFTVSVSLYNFFMKSLANSVLFGFQASFILNLGTFFIAGSLLSSLQIEKVKNKGLFLSIVFLVFIVSIYFNFYNMVMHFILPIGILLLGLIPLPFFSAFGKMGDMSYGIYIYSFPIQQALIHFFQLKVYTLMLTSTVLSIGLGFLSWHVVEKKALWLKKTIYLNPLLK